MLITIDEIYCSTNLLFSVRKNQGMGIQSTDTFSAMDIRHCVEIAPFNYVDQSGTSASLASIHPFPNAETSGHAELTNRFYTRGREEPLITLKPPNFHFVSFEILDAFGYQPIVSTLILAL